MESLNRREILRLGAWTGAGWLTTAAHLMAREAERTRSTEPAKSVILLWLSGGPSQLETFDPHPDKSIAGGTKAIATNVAGIQFAAGLERLAEQMDSLAVIRSMVTKEGDHERGSYLVKTGYSPIPALIHPSLGAICCHELPDVFSSGLKTEIPRHVSILPDQWPARGGFLGDQYDAFKTFDPSERVPDVLARVEEPRLDRRIKDLELVERAFSRGREPLVARTLHRDTINNARLMMTSEQLKAFDVSEEPKGVRESFGDTPFGRGCLAARRLTEVGVRCVEVTLSGWDSHANNHSVHEERVKTLDPALAALIADLKERELLHKTIVICAGEFGRTPTINPVAGRDHWPTGFSIALAGGGIKGGQVLGSTDPEGSTEVDKPQSVPDVHATILSLLGIEYDKEIVTPIQRPIKLCEGMPIEALIG